MRILGIIGPSGTGKTTILSRLYEEGLVYINPTYTDRLRRKGEEPLEHEFITRKEFDKLQDSDYFAEVVQPFGLEYRYGVPYLKQQGGKIVVLMLRVQFLPLLNKHYPDNVIYQIEAPLSVAKDRIKDRDDNKPGTRLKDFQKELEQGRLSADRVFVNDNQKQCIAQIKEALNSDFNSI